MGRKKQAEAEGKRNQDARDHQGSGRTGIIRELTLKKTKRRKLTPENIRQEGVDILTKFHTV